MDRDIAKGKLAALSPAARAAWSSDTLDGVDATVVSELQAAGLVEHIPSWSDAARELADALGEREGVDALIERIDQETLPDAIDELEAWTESGVLETYDLEPAQARGVIGDAVDTMRSAYDGMLDKLRGLRSVDRAEAA